MQCRQTGQYELSTLNTISLLQKGFIATWAHTPPLPVSNHSVTAPTHYSNKENGYRSSYYSTATTNSGVRVEHIET
jgi:hypothetical protein